MHITKHTQAHLAMPLLMTSDHFCKSSASLDAAGAAPLPSLTSPPPLPPPSNAAALSNDCTSDLSTGDELEPAPLFACVLSPSLPSSASRSHLCDFHCRLNRSCRCSACVQVCMSVCVCMCVCVCVCLCVCLCERMGCVRASLSVVCFCVHMCGNIYKGGHLFICVCGCVFW